MELCRVGEGYRMGVRRREKERHTVTAEVEAVITKEKRKGKVDTYHIASCSCRECSLATPSQQQSHHGYIAGRGLDTAGACRKRHRIP